MHSDLETALEELQAATAGWLTSCSRVSIRSAKIRNDDAPSVRARPIDRLLRDGMLAEAEQLLPKMLARRSIEELSAVAAHVLEMMCATPPEGAAAALRGRAERLACEDTLRSVTVPALVVVGSEDAFTTREDAERMRELLQDAELVWRDGVVQTPR